MTEAAFRSIGWDGRHLVIGFAAGDIPKVPLNLALLKSGSLVGVFWGAFLRRDAKQTEQHKKDLFAVYSSGKVKPPVTKSYSLEEAGQALLDLSGRKVKGKVVVVPG